MEPYEKLKNLTESEKAKYFEVVLESLKLASDDSNEPGNDTNKKLSLNTIFHNFASGHVSSEGSPRKKQKTLDSWLIKPKTSNKKESGESSRTLEESSDIILNSDTNNISEHLDSTQSKLNSSSVPSQLSASTSKINENYSKSAKYLPCESDKVYNCFVKAVPISQPETSESTCIISRKGSSRSKKKCTESSQLSSLKKSNRVITQSHINNNCDPNCNISSENNASEHNRNVVLEESSKSSSTSNVNNISECSSFSPSKLNNSNDETSLNLSKNPENSTQSLEHSPCKSDTACNNFLKDVQISQPQVNESTGIVSRKGNLRSKKKCPESSQLSKPKNSTKSNLNDSVSLNKSNSVVTQSHLANNSDVNHNVSPENIVSEDDIILHSDTNDILECVDSTQSKLNNSNDENYLNSSKSSENSLQNAKHLPCKSDKECNSFVKEVQNSQPEVSESPRIVTRTRSKRKCIEPSQLSKPESSTKSSTFTNNSNLHKSNRVVIQSDTTNNCDVKHGASPENFASESSNLASKNDYQETGNLILLNKGTRNLRSRKVSINLPSIPQSSTKFDQNATKTSDITKKILSPEKDNPVDSLLLSNQKAFQILEKECSRININVLDILQDETVQNVLNSPDRLDNDTFFLINSFKSSNERTLPVVHLVESWKKISEIVKKLKKSV